MKNACPATAERNACPPRAERISQSARESVLSLLNEFEKTKEKYICAPTSSF